MSGASKAAAVPRYLVPEEIIREILLWLPAKSLGRFSKVCKSWNSMIKHSSFIDTHLKRRGQHNKRNGIVHLLLCENYAASSCTSYVMKDAPATLTRDECYTKFRYPSSKHVNADLCSLIGTCNGLICLAGDELLTSTPAVPTLLWNPSIRKIVILPRLGFKSTTGYYVQTHAFGYDAQSNDYKVLRILQLSGTWKTTRGIEVDVYSLARNSWKRLGGDTFSAYLKSVIWCTDKYVHVNNALHWPQYRDTEMEKHIIVSFDMAGELFSETEMPEAFSDELNKHILVARYGESLALIDVKSGFDIWVMKEYGVVQSWTKIARISCEMFRVMSLFDCKSSGELVFGIIQETTTGRDGLRRVNYKTNQVEKFTTTTGGRVGKSLGVEPPYPGSNPSRR